ncbi:16S rRNA (guanine(966)-N(2))-methyltransferase RsmD [Candidatus Vidania fulgoroideorum]
MKKKLKSIKILSGKLKNKKIKFSYNFRIRPTKSILKKSFFSIIGKFIENKFCLDLFSGSGSLGFEALSRGASFVLFNDNKYKNIKNIKKNLKRLSVKKKKYLLLCNDYFYIFKKKLFFDIIFLDPPFKLFYCLNKILKKINNILKINGFIYLETNKVFCFKNKKLKIYKIGKKGKIFYYLIKKLF